MAYTHSTHEQNFQEEQRMQSGAYKGELATSQGALQLTLKACLPALFMTGLLAACLPAYDQH